MVIGYGPSPSKGKASAPRQASPELGVCCVGRRREWTPVTPPEYEQRQLCPANPLSLKLYWPLQWVYHWLQQYACSPLKWSLMKKLKRRWTGYLGEPWGPWLCLEVELEPSPMQHVWEVPQPQPCSVTVLIIFNANNITMLIILSVILSGLQSAASQTQQLRDIFLHLPGMGPPKREKSALSSPNGWKVYFLVFYFRVLFLGDIGDSTSINANKMFKAPFSAGADLCPGRGWLLSLPVPGPRPWGQGWNRPRQWEGCSILAFSKITDSSSQWVKKSWDAIGSCQLELLSFYLSRKLWLRSLVPFLLPAFWKAVSCPTS